MLVLSLRSTAPARDKVTLVLALRRLRTRGLRLQMSMPTATIREARRFVTARLCSSYVACGGRAGYLLVSYTTLAPSCFEVAAATLALRLQQLHAESTGLSTQAITSRRAFLPADTT